MDFVVGCEVVVRFFFSGWCGHGLRNQGYKGSKVDVEE